MGQRPAKHQHSVRIFKQVQANIVVIGVRKSGMSSIMEKMIPTGISDSSLAGNASSTVSPCKGVNLITWGIGFGNERPPLWKYHVKNADGLLLIIDSGNQRTLVTMKEELAEIFESKIVTESQLPVVVLANKTDLGNARSASDIADVLLLYEYSITWNVQCCSALTGEGVSDGFRKLMELIRMRKVPLERAMTVKPKEKLRTM